MDPKQLKKLAAECRKAGIKRFKCADFEFELSEDLPPSKTRAKARQEAPASPNERFESDSLSQDEILFWSTGIANDGAGAEDN